MSSEPVSSTFSNGTGGSHFGADHAAAPTVPSFFRPDYQGTYVVAEAEINHNGDAGTALRMVDAAHAAGANAIKFQFIVADEIATPDSPYYAIFKKVELTAEQFEKISGHARALGIDFFLTVPSIKTLAPVLQLKPHLIKVGSTNLTNLPLLETIGRARVPVVLSTGIGRLGDIEDALAALQSPPLPVALMHCTVQYPAPVEQLNLRALTTMAAAFPDQRIGYSDHTIGWVAAVAAVALGARLIEKHFTLDRKQEGPDHSFSTEPADFKVLVDAIRQTEAALGNPKKQPAPAELPMIRTARRYLVASRAVAAGQRLSADDVALRRVPAGCDGIEARYLHFFVGWKSPRNFKVGEPLTWAAFKQSENP